MKVTGALADGEGEIREFGRRPLRRQTCAVVVTPTLTVTAPKRTGLVPLGSTLGTTLGVLLRSV